jgi:AAA+ ATPase superfamily predicted ATPase
MNLAEFVGRETELELLRGKVNSPRSSVCVVYGRRRIGKSALVEKALEGARSLTFEGLEGRPKQRQIDHFLTQLTHQTNTVRPCGEIRNWYDAFMLLYESIRDNPRHIVLDEFQWMANYRAEIVSDLKPAWEQYLSKIPGLTLFLCGSIASFMVKRVIRSSALYGRIDAEIHVRPFHINEARYMLPDRGISEILDAYLLSGGVPKYLDLLREGPSVLMNMAQLGFSENGYFFGEYKRIFVSHFGKQPAYERIIASLAAHPYGLFRQQLVEKARVQAGGALSEHLDNLQKAGFITAATPIDKSPNSRYIKYFLSDAYMRFYHAFILPNQSTILARTTDDIFLRRLQDAAAAAWMGRSFEYFCLYHAKAMAQMLGFSGIDYKCGPYFRPAKGNKPGVQVDLLFDRSDHVVTLCEAKYSAQPVGVSVIPEVEKRAEQIRAACGTKTIQKVLITRVAPTRDLAASGYFYRVIKAEDFLV